MLQPRPLRTGALTILVFLLIQPLATGLLFVALSALGAAFSGSTNVAVVSPLLGVLLGFLMQLLGAGFTGFVMAVLSHRIRSMAGWLCGSALAGAVLAFLIILFPLRATFSGGTLMTGLLFAGAAAALSALGAFGAAAATLKVRSRPWLRPVSEAFD